MEYEDLMRIYTTVRPAGHISSLPLSLSGKDRCSSFSLLLCRITSHVLSGVFHACRYKHSHMQIHVRLVSVLYTCEHTTLASFVRGYARKQHDQRQIRCLY